MSFSPISVDKSLMKAKSFIKKGDFKEAQTIYEKILKNYPQNIRVQKALHAIKSNTTSFKTINVPQAIIDQLLNLYNQQKFEELLEQADKLLGKYSNSHLIWNIIGAAHQALGRFDEAFKAFKQTVTINPNFAEGYNNLGIVLKEQDKLDDALDALKKALFLNPNDSNFINNLGTILKDQSKFHEAMSAYQKTLKLNPNSAEALFNIGECYRELCDLEKAIIYYYKGLKLTPHNISAILNLVNIFKIKGEIDKALQYLHKALSLNPSLFEGYFLLGLILKDKGETEDALKAYQKALSINPNYAHAHNNIAIILANQGDLKVALKIFEQAIKCDPKFVQPYNNIGSIKLEKLQLQEALEFFDKSLKLDPQYVLPYFNKAAIYERLGKRKDAIDLLTEAVLIDPSFELARAQKLHQQAHICDWQGIEDERSWIPKLGIHKQEIVPISLLSLEDSPGRHKKRSELYCKNKFLQKPLPFDFKIKERHKPIHVAYFSSDFREHPVAYLIAKVLEQHNRDKFKVYGYSIKKIEKDHLHKRLVGSFDVFRELGELSDKEAALLSREDRIDIAINLNGYTQNSRTGIFAYRAAPIQINYLGYPGTLGTDFMDYIIADRTLITKDTEQFYSERPIYLPDTYMPTDNTRQISKKLMTRKEMDLPEDGFVFCCFNNNYKITSEEFEIWMRLLGKVKDSVLWLRKSNEWSENNFRKEAQKRNINPSRLVFAGTAIMEEHLARHKLADLFLDTFNFNAHTTASEALWAGLPVVTKIGRGFAARVAGSLLKAIDLSELITETNEEYEALILELATNEKKLLTIREKLKSNHLSKPLFNTELYTKNLENAYLEVYKNYSQGNKTKIINVI